MELNSTIWGTYADNAQRISSGTSGDSLYYSDKAGAESLLDYYTMYGHNEPIDESINYWQVADFSSFNRYVYMHLNGNNVFEYTTTKAVKPLSIFLAKAKEISKHHPFFCSFFNRQKHHSLILHLDLILLNDTNQVSQI